MSLDRAKKGRIGTETINLSGPGGTGIGKYFTFPDSMSPVAIIAFLGFVVSLVVYSFIREKDILDIVKICLGAMLGSGVSSSIKNNQNQNDQKRQK